MKPICSAVTMFIALAVYAPGAKYVNLPGYAYKTDPTCQRTEPRSRFDRKCDWPRLGIKDFTAPPPIVFGI
ncbi:hypothetical protein HFO56_02090 [Rhizobium laguerreae]|nr:hypothetical protein [Rhizobium laguerreae]MBY3151197.1 hypothetical protein [Rhizobium laguerreae]